MTERVKSTNFTLKELMLIERTFETNTSIWIDDYKHMETEAIREDLINGLTAVVKVILKMDNCPESVIDVFTKRVCNKPIEHEEAKCEHLEPQDNGSGIQG